MRPGWILLCTNTMLCLENSHADNVQERGQSIYSALNIFEHGDTGSETAVKNKFWNSVLVSCPGKKPWTQLIDNWKGHKTGRTAVPNIC